MALVECRFFSETLSLSTSMTVVLPLGAGEGVHGRADTKGKLSVLWLLHGLSGDHTTWVRRTSIERYAEKWGIAVVMPEVARSYYADMANGLKYWSFISEELPAIARSLFPLSTERERNFVAGLSMGGYGAYKLAFSFPDRYAAAASLSGALDPFSFLSSVKHEPGRKTDIRCMFGRLENIPGSLNDLYFLVKRLKKRGGNFPALFQCCGTEDFLYKDNIRFRDFLNKNKVKVTYQESKGSHEWGFWDENIQSVLRWLPL